MSGPYTVTIPAQRTTASFDVSIIRDQILEYNEEFIVTIDPLSLPNSVTVGDDSMVAIIDDEGNTLMCTLNYIHTHSGSV